MSDEIIKVLDAVCAKFGVVIDWSAENVLPYVQQLTEKFIRWEISTSIAWVVIMCIVLAILVMVAKISLPKAKEVGWDLDCIAPWICGLATGCAALFTLVLIIVFGKQLMDIVTCCTFPEKAILDYAMSIVNK